MYWTFVYSTHAPPPAKRILAHREQILLPVYSTRAPPLAKQIHAHREQILLPVKIRQNGDLLLDVDSIKRSEVR